MAIENHGYIVENRGYIAAGGLEDYLVSLLRSRQQKFVEHTALQQQVCATTDSSTFKSTMAEVRRLSTEILDLDERINETRREIRRR